MSSVVVPWRKMNEYCGVVGVYKPNAHAAEFVHRGLLALQHRGQEAAGIVSVNQQGVMHHLRNRGLVAEALPLHQTQHLAGEKAIGHVRYSTVAFDQSENIQPFLSQTPYGRFAIAHNGNLKNADQLKRELTSRGALLSTTMDSELIVHLMTQSGATNVIDALRVAAARMVGAYSLVMICNQRLLALRDPHGVRPLVLGEFKNESNQNAGYVVASETCALKSMGAHYIRDIQPGELLEIGVEGVQSMTLLAPQKPAPCVFELVYFARPDSNVFQQNVHVARTRMGEQLALEEAFTADNKPDVVVPVPDSGFPAAIGYARKSGIPLEKAIIRSHYIGRTFILPTQDQRAHALHLKLSVIPEAVQGKRVLLIDDSLVRGNTSRLIVQMVRDAGAKEVLMRIASPPLAWPCYLGIDTPTREELVINQQKHVEGVRQAVGADSLRYLSLEGLKLATQQQSFCFACMNGDYPV